MSHARLEPQAWADEWVVRCPICEDDYQHHGDVAVFERAGGEDGRRIVTAPAGMVTGSNPSSRRDAIRVAFEGECGHEWWLDIIQHKGQTFVSCRVLDEDAGALP